MRQPRRPIIRQVVTVVVFGTRLASRRRNAVVGIRTGRFGRKTQALKLSIEKGTARGVTRGGGADCKGFCRSPCNSVRFWS